MMRVRVRFAKRGKVRWTSHRDVARMWERAFRRARMPVLYTEGFSPRPKVSFGLALPTGQESVAEYLDVDLAEDVGLAEVPRRLSEALPVGVDAMAVSAVGSREGSLQQEVTSCEWRLEVGGASPREAEGLVEAALAACALDVRRRRKGQEVADDLRPSILRLEVLGGAGDGVVLGAEVSTRPRGVRPGELLGALGSGLELRAGLRTRQWIDRDGARREPIPLGATDAARAMERAS